MNLTAFDVTNDNNYDAPIVHLVAGDSLSHSLVGDWKEGMNAPDLSGYNVQQNTALRPPFYGGALWAFKVTKWLRDQGIYTRLVNKGFGGSDMIQKQYAQLLRGYYAGIPFDLLTVTIGANDSTELWTTDRKTKFKARLEEFVNMRNELRPGKPINFITPWILDDIASRGPANLARNYVDDALTDNRTRLKICRDLIFEQMDDREDENIFVIDGFLADNEDYRSLPRLPLKDSSFNADTGIVTNTLANGTINDDLYYKYNSANPTNDVDLPGFNEQTVGYRVHRSGQGHQNCANLIVAKWQEQPWFQDLAPVS
jgi:hypothetical protein